MDRSLWLIFNPNAGPENVYRIISRVRSYWQQQGWRVSLWETRAPGHAAELARRAAEQGCRMVLAAGGDGTLGQVAHGLAGSETVLAVLPIGTANVFAKLLNLVPNSLRPGLAAVDLCERLVSGNVQSIDLGKAFAPELPPEGYHFISWAGTGLDGNIVDRMEPRPKWVKHVTGRRLGWTPYLVAGVPSAMRFSGLQARVGVDGYILSDTFLLVLVANCRLYGGGMVQLSPDARLDDGLLDIWLFKGKMFSDAVGHALRLLTSRHMMSEDTVHLRGRQISVQPVDSATIELDGEPRGCAPLSAIIAPGVLQLLVPAGAPDDLFCRPGIPLASFDEIIRRKHVELC